MITTVSEGGIQMVDCRKEYSRTTHKLNSGDDPDHRRAKVDSSIKTWRIVRELPFLVKWLLNNTDNAHIAKSILENEFLVEEVGICISSGVLTDSGDRWTISLPEEREIVEDHPERETREVRMRDLEKLLVLLADCPLTGNSRLNLAAVKVTEDEKELLIARGIISSGRGGASFTDMGRHRANTAKAKLTAGDDLTKSEAPDSAGTAAKEGSVASTEVAPEASSDVASSEVADTNQGMDEIVESIASGEYVANLGINGEKPAELTQDVLDKLLATGLVRYSDSGKLEIPLKANINKCGLNHELEVVGTITIY
jgi:hypothetical protein